MHTNVWYELALLELSGDDPLRERLREAEAVQLPSADAAAEPTVVEPGAVEPEAAAEEDWTC
jgi:hypothetical protein